MNDYPIRFLIGANTPVGFFGFHQTDLYDARDGWAAFLIKSGAGTGKATFMREVAALLAPKTAAEAIFCSSDPDSLDAVIFPDIKLCLVDATHPHVIEPIAYGECEQIVPFGCCLKPAVTLAQADAWFDAADACARAHARCCRFSAAAHSLLQNNRLIAERALLNDKTERTAARLAAKAFPLPAAKRGKETRRFLSAVTPKGYLFFADTACALCPTLYQIEDEYGAAASRLTSLLRDEALSRGLDIITCRSPFSPQDTIDHLLIPSLGIGFLTSNSLHRIDFPVYRRLHAARFLDGDALKSHKQQLRFNRRAAEELIAEAVRASADAKAHHDRMEALHTAAMDWDEWRRIADTAKAQILAVANARLS
ncbi:MAG: hypothetical protein IKV35_07005 [Clostridia bacterium]|nr:hypothetical protein [Clostridia bacterium]